MSFPSISITGSFCALRCKHCEGKILKTMLPATTPQNLVDVCTEIENRGGEGCLISGGCLADGSVPLGEFVDAIAKVKRSLKLKVVAHTGIIDFRLATRLKEAGVDAALIDVIGSDATIKEICQLDANVDDYERSLSALHDSGIALVPHVLVGLHYGKLLGESQALQMISKYSPSALIIIGLMPMQGTPMQNRTPPTPLELAKVLVAAKLMMPTTPLVLGCMRPKGEHKMKMDTLAVKAGVDAIAFPTEEAVRIAESLRLRTSFSSSCCSQIYVDMKAQPRANF
jgi:hypothetical protein